MTYNSTFTLSQLIDYLLEGSDLDAQGALAKAAARHLLMEAAQHFREHGGAELVEIALPLTRRLVGHPSWNNKLNLADLTAFCVAKLPDYPAGIESNHPGLDVQAEYLSKCAEEYIARW